MHVPSTGGPDGAGEDRARRSRRRHLALALLAAVLYSNFLIDLAVSGPHEWAQQVSVLEIPGHRSATLLRITDVCAALLVLAQLPAVRRALRAAGTGGTADRWAADGPADGWAPDQRAPDGPATDGRGPGRGARLLRGLVVGGAVLFALGGILAAAVTLPAGTGTGADSLTTASGVLEPAGLRAAVHNGASILSVGGMVASAGAAWLLLRRLSVGPAAHERPRWLGPIMALVAVGLVVELASDPLVLLRPDWALLDGLAQRAQMVTLSAWIVGLGALAARAPSPR